MQILIVLLVVLNLALTGYLIVRLRDSGTTAPGANPAAGHERARLLVVAAGSVVPGTDRQSVERQMGVAANPFDNEWLYYLDRNSGYLVKFDSQDRVQSVTSWKS